MEWQGQNGSDARPSGRIVAIDVLRGLAMALMVIDHVRVYSGVSAGGPEPAVFFTRWITHFCAPAFFLLSGVSAFLRGRKRPGLARYLLSRGLLLVVLELTVLRLSWAFNTNFGTLMAGVLWALGWSMVALAAISRLPVKAVAVLAMGIIAGHNLLDGHFESLARGMEADLSSALWSIGYLGFFGRTIRIESIGASLLVLYSLIPWVGVMALGYALGPVFGGDKTTRNRVCVRLGLAFLGGFFVLRGLSIYGDPGDWRSVDPDYPMPTVLAFLNTTKYPASLCFLLMTLGPLLLAVPLGDRARGFLGRSLQVFGREPLFFYLLHIPLIHALALLVSWVRMGSIVPWLFLDHPLPRVPPPSGYTWGLWLLYAVALLALLLLYFATAWFEGMRRKSRSRWIDLI